MDFTNTSKRVDTWFVRYFPGIQETYPWLSKQLSEFIKNWFQEMWREIHTFINRLITYYIQEKYKHREMNIPSKIRNQKFTSSKSSDEKDKLTINRWKIYFSPLIELTLKLLWKHNSRAEILKRISQHKVSWQSSSD